MTERWHHAFTKNDADFKELFGVKKEIFQEMLSQQTEETFVENESYLCDFQQGAADRSGVMGVDR